MDSLDKIKDFIRSCILPELKHDLDSIPIEKDDFKNYYEHLEISLPLLYDYIQQYPKNFLWSGKTNELTKREMQAFLIILLCEISSPSSIFKLNQIELIQNAEKILQNSSNISKTVDDLIFKYYEEKLHKEKWKRQLGTVHGFVKYLEYRYDTDCNPEEKMSRKFLVFCLSVALNIRTCYDNLYKTLSTSIFMIMLRKGANDDIVSMNIHGVIYDAVFKDVYILDSNYFITHQWNCLIKCLDFYENFDSFTWSYLDDMTEVLLRNISLSSDNATSICLLKFLNKLIVYFTINNKEFEEFIENNTMLVANINECRLLANTNNSYTCYRWAKKILELFVIESYKLFQSTEDAKKMLQEIHKTYILAILPIILPVVESILIIFLEKYIPVLMETVKVNKHKEDIIKTITLLLETFYFHLQSSKECSRLHIFEENIYALLKTDVFGKYASI